MLSNSLSYLLTASGERLDLNYRFYERDFCTILRGYKKATCVVPTARGNLIELHYHDGFSLARGGEERRAQRPLPPNYRSFSHYVDYLLETMEAIGRNASDPTRLRQYEWLSTLSLGYDSPACTILARQLGVTRAVNFVGGRHGHEEDSSDIARMLGIELIQHDRDEYLPWSTFPRPSFSHQETEAMTLSMLRCPLNWRRHSSSAETLGTHFGPCIRSMCPLIDTASPPLAA